MHGDVDLLQWCEDNCESVFYDCEGCGSGPMSFTPREGGCDNVPVDAAAVGHVDMVMYCLDGCWEYTDSIMQAAASERRVDVIEALQERGHSASEEAASVTAGGVAGEGGVSSMIDKWAPPRCLCGWDGFGHGEVEGLEEESP